MEISGSKLVDFEEYLGDEKFAEKQVEQFTIQFRLTGPKDMYFNSCNICNSYSDF